jgi:fluoroquinolone transport system permease protein
MNRVFSATLLDLRLQQRYGFFYAAAFVTLVWVVVLRLVPAEMLGVALPFIIFADLGIVGVYFIAGMVLFEKGEQTLEALVVTPLRFREYLSARLATLTLLALVISLIVVLATYGLGFNLLWLVLGVVLTSLISLLVGFISVAPYRAISAYLLPSQLYFLPLNLPIIDYFGWWEHPIFYLVPTQGSLLLLRGAFEPLAAWQVGYAIGYQVLWIGLLAWVARRMFDRYIVGRQGGK